MYETFYGLFEKLVEKGIRDNTGLSVTALNPLNIFIALSIIS